MSKSIETLVPDIQQLLRDSLTGKGVKLTVDQQAALGARLAAKTARALDRGEARSRPPKTVYMSEIGKPCLRQLWYSYHMPELGEKLLPHTQFKFLYGDYLEELVLFLAKIAGHDVRDEQKLIAHQYNGWTLRGKQDAVIDGVLVDVKSASSYSFKKFQEGLTDENDSFGYRVQLQSYNVPHNMTRPMGFLVVDKQNGTLQWAPMKTLVNPNLADRWMAVIKALEGTDGSPPPRRYDLQPEGKSGNEKLGVECSYCPYKKECWKDSNAGYGLRAFSYAGRPVFLGTVVREPKVPEIPLEADSATSTTEPADESVAA